MNDPRFKGKIDMRRFTRLMLIATMFQGGYDWDDTDVTDSVRDMCERDARKYGFPDGWQQQGSYAQIKEWYFKNCQK